MIDQYTSYGPGSAQLQWITSDLSASTKPWKFVVLHEPGWSAGGNHPNNTQVQTDMQPLCLQYGVSIVFGGHNHYYARAVVNGIEHLTIGGGGAPLYTPDPSYPYVVASARAYHYCKIAISGGTLTFQAVTPAGFGARHLHLAQSRLGGVAARAGQGRPGAAEPLLKGTTIDGVLPPERTSSSSMPPADWSGASLPFPAVLAPPAGTVRMRKAGRSPPGFITTGSIRRGPRRRGSCWL